MPTPTHTIIRGAREPPGTPAVPAAVMTLSTIAITCWPSVRFTPNNWARNSTVTPSYKAVPLWHMVEPRDNRRAAISGGTFSSCSATARLVGRVEAPDERPRSLFGDQRQSGAEDQREEDDPEHVEIGRRLDRVRGHNFHEEIDSKGGGARAAGTGDLPAIGVEQLLAHFQGNTDAGSYQIDKHDADHGRDERRQEEVAERPHSNATDLADVPELRHAE